MNTKRIFFISCVVVLAIISYGCLREYYKVIGRLDALNESNTKMQTEIQNVTVLNHDLQNTVRILMDKLDLTDDELVAVKSLDVYMHNNDAKLEDLKFEIEELRQENWINDNNTEYEIDFLNSYLDNLEGYSEPIDVVLRISDEGTIEYDLEEWIFVDDLDKIENYGLNPNEDFPNGFHIYNPLYDYERLELDENVEYFILAQNFMPKRVFFDSFEEQIEYYGNEIHCALHYYNDELVAIVEYYLP